MTAIPNNTLTGSPDTSASMAIKRTPAYGAQYAKQMWSTYWNGSFRMGINSWEDYAYMRAVAHGRQSLESVKSYLGFVSGEQATQGYTWFDVQVLNFATRFIEKAKDELRKVDYDITVDAIDPLSLDEKKNFQNYAKSVLEMKAVIEAFGKKYQDIMPSFPEGWQPTSTEELNVYIQAGNHKIQDEIEAELAIKEDLNWSNWAHVRNMMYDDWLVIGIAGCRTFVDQNGQRKTKYVPIERSIMSMPDDESFDNLVHAGVVEYITVEQFRWESAAFYSKEQQDRIIKEQASYNGYGRYDKNGYWYGGYFPDGKEWIAVLRFEFLAPDTKVWVKSTDKKGRTHYNEKEAGYEPGVHTVNGQRIVDEEARARVMADIESGAKEVLRDDRMSCYGGTWVIGSDYCYNYDLLECDKYVSLGFKFHAPNMRNGSVSSMLKQILEPMELANIAYNMQKQILGRGWMGILDVDYSKLFDIALGKDGDAWSPMQVMDLFFQKQIGIHNEVQNGQGSMAFQIQQSGLTMKDYEDTIIGCVQKMVTITGVDPRIESGTNISAESLKIVNEATQGALGYLYHAYQQTYSSVGRTLLKFNPKFSNNFRYRKQFVVGAAKMTTAQEWAEFKARVNKYASVPMSEGGLGPDDEAAIDVIQNIKLAQIVLAYRVKRNMARAQQMKQQDMELQSQLNDQNAQLTAQMRMQEINAEYDGKIRYREFDHMAKMEEIGATNTGLLNQRHIQGQYLMETERRKGTDKLITEKMWTDAEIEQTAMKNANDRALAGAKMYQDAAIHESEKIHELEMHESEKEHDKEIERMKPKPKAAS